MSTERLHPYPGEGSRVPSPQGQLPFGPLPGVQELLKHDGTRVPFDKACIAESIARAARECGETEPDWAHDLASAVALFLQHSSRSNSAPITTQAVSEAVEKVLLEMGHARIAVAYARFRDRRARQRTLDAAGASPLPRPARADAPAVTVWRSDDAVAPWDRDQVAAILMREADLTRADAASIAEEVEELVIKGGFREVTTALIRELAGARLVERGLHAARTRHARLGVPLYDAEHMITMPGADQVGPGAGPRDSDRMLAERVKREYALARVFDHDTAEAHLDGTLHLSALGQVDRLERMVLSPDWVARFGAPRPGHPTPASPPQYVEAFCVHLARTHALLADYAVQPIEWDALNVHMAPFVPTADATALRRAAQWVLTEFTQGPPSVLHLHWNVPPYLTHAAPRQQGAYADHEPTARAFLFALLQEALDGDACGGSWQQPDFVVHISQAMLASESGRSALRLAARAAAEGNAISFRFARGGDQLELGAPPWQPVRMVAHALTLNLPRAVYRTGARLELLRPELGRLATVAATVHRQKQAFLRTLMTHGDAGPLGLLAQRHESGSWFAPEGAEYGVGVTGLAETVRYLRQAGVTPGDGALDIARTVLLTLHEALAERAEDTGIALRLDGYTDAAAAGRLATLDLDEYRASAVSALGPGRSAYTPGARLRDRADADTLPDFALHPCYDHAPEGRIRIPDDGPHGADNAAAWLQRLFTQTDCQQVRFEVG